MPTNKQRLAAKKLLENPGMAISKVMVEVGYDEDTAKNPSDLTESKGWAELMEEYMPDTLLGEKHKALLNKKETINVRSPDGVNTQIETDQLDANAVSKGLDMAYKLKGYYKPTENKVTLKGEISDDDLDARIQARLNKVN